MRCDDAGEVVRSKLFLGHFERHNGRLPAEINRIHEFRNEQILTAAGLAVTIASQQQKHATAFARGSCHRYASRIKWKAHASNEMALGLREYELPGQPPVRGLASPPVP